MATATPPPQEEPDEPIAPAGAVGFAGQDHARFAAARWRRLALATAGLDEDTAPTDPAANALHLSATSGRYELSGNLDLVTGSRTAAAFDAEIATLFRTGRFASDDGLMRSQRLAVALDAIITRANATPTDVAPTDAAPPAEPAPADAAPADTEAAPADAAPAEPAPVEPATPAWRSFTGWWRREHRTDELRARLGLAPPPWLAFSDRHIEVTTHHLDPDRDHGTAA